MKILAIDTTEQACSAALLVDGRVAEDFRIAARQHSQLILPMIEGLLGDAGLALSALDGLAFARGPGSFTGVRIAAAVVQGLAVAADLQVVPVSSLLALAQGVYREHGEQRVLAAFDARMQEIYWVPCEVRDGLMQFAGNERVSALEAIALPPGDDAWAMAGSALGAYGEAIEQQLGSRSGARYPDAVVYAQDVALLAQQGFARGEAVAAEQAIPVYLRDQVAHKMPGAGRA